MFEIIGCGLLISLVVMFAGLVRSLLAARSILLRVLGYVIVLLAVFVFVDALLPLLREEINVYKEPTNIVNDLRRICGAARVFRESHGRPPLPGEEASLDLYMDTPLVAVEHPRYAKVTLSGELLDDMGASVHYVGIELIPGKNGTRRIQKKLAVRANDVGILEELPSGDKKASPYTSGLNVYMKYL
jgi:hypothetical protein